jgi:uncharacterized protein involved in exopolysaccharide biosynthesis
MTTQPKTSNPHPIQAIREAPPQAPDPAHIQRFSGSFLSALIVLAERKRMILLTTVIFAVVAAMVSLLLKSRYTASVTFMPPQQNSSLSNAFVSQMGSMSGVAALASSGLGLKNPNDMFVGMLKSRSVEESMVKRFGLMQEYRQKFLSGACKALEDHSVVDGSGKDGLIHISIWDADPKRAAELANGYLDQFRVLSEHLAITEASQRRLFFERQLLQAKDNLANAEEALKQTEQKTGLIHLDSQARALIQSAVTLRAQIAAKEVEIQSLRTFATSENSQLIQAQQELESMRTQLAKLGGSDNLDTGLMVPKGQVPQAGLEYVRKLRDVKYYETIFEILARQFEIAKLDEAKEGSTVQVVDSANPPDRRSFPNRVLIVVIATFLGFSIGILIALLQAGYQHLQSSQGSAEKIQRLRNLLRLRNEKPA